MSDFATKVVLNSTSGYSDKHDPLLLSLIDSKVLLFCVVGKDCELWHDIMDEMFVGNGDVERDFHMMTTWHNDETLDDVVEFAEIFHIDHGDNESVQIIEI